MRFCGAIPFACSFATCSLTANHSHSRISRSIARRMRRDDTSWRSARARIVAPRGRGRYKLARASVHSFGDTLEWLVATILEREFLIPALWNVRVEALPGAATATFSHAPREG
jgi:hypothetical protein